MEKLGSAEHKAQYLEDLLKQIHENIMFGDFQLWTIRQSIEKLQADKKEAEAKLERKEFASAGEGRKEIERLDEGIQSFLMSQAEIETQNKVLANRIIELNEYVKASGRQTA